MHGIFITEKTLLVIFLRMEHRSILLAMAAASGAIFDQIILLPVNKNIFVSICFISLVLKIT